MANPITLGTLGVSAASTMMGATLGAMGSEYKGSAEAAMYNYQAGVAQVNAQVAKQDANYALASGEVEQEQSGMRTAAQIGATRAAFGASNVGGGSKDRVLASEREIGAQNQGIIAANAAKRAYGFQVGAAEDTAQAGMYREAATTSITAGELGATSSILGGVSSVASKWLGVKNAFTKSGDGGGGSGSTGDAVYDSYGFNVS